VACKDDGGANDNFGTGNGDDGSDDGDGSGDGDDGGDGSSGGSSSDGSGDGDDGDDGAIFDVGGNADLGGGGGCDAEEHTPCDADTGDFFKAIGLNCPGELQVNGEVNGDPTGFEVIDHWGENDTYDPREGSAYLVISTGDLAEKNDVPSDPGDAGYHCNSWFPEGGAGDTSSFPPPIDPTPVDGDCLANPALVGTGDCSKSIEGQFNQSGFKYDYQDVRFTATVPEGAESLSFDVAFLTKEYPIWYERPYNDMFIGWLESSTWTGNVSFDDAGNPLSLNAAFLELFDDDGDLPEFAGTCMRYSAGTRWLTTTASVTAGDEIELVFAIFDLDDVNWDSFAFVDNVRWGCGEVPPGPDTNPAG